MDQKVKISPGNQGSDVGIARRQSEPGGSWVGTIPRWKK